MSEKQRTDLYEEMPQSDQSYISSLDDELTRSADLVLYVNRALYEQGVGENQNSLLLGHGVDFDFFVNSTKSERVPDDIAEIPRGTMMASYPILARPSKRMTRQKCRSAAGGSKTERGTANLGRLEPR